MGKMTEEEKRICRWYSWLDKEGYMHCHECPLNRSSDVSSVMCKADGHYSMQEQGETWVPDGWKDE